ncbi:MAG TPA: hypothetical protein VHJ20_01110 [Polyangia bacterium]|nr:hypothetical protein [Polyangia bacterium]
MKTRKGLTLRLRHPRESDFSAEAVCVFSALGTEDRSRLPCWDDRISRDPGSCSEIVEQDASNIGVKIAGKEEKVSLRDRDSLARVFQSREIAYLDISGLAHHVWAPLVRVGLEVSRELWVVYVEPSRYRPHPSPASATMFDLSTEIGGVAGLPGFANLKGAKDETKAVFVPLLGFEGMRARQVAMALDPMPPNVIPIIGVPGFRIEYPFVAVSCNQEFLDEYAAHDQVRMSRASCPFEAYRVLEDIRRDLPGAYMYLAPIGTKPQALGAVWYAIEHPDDTEIMYDHPKRRPQRTSGVGPTHVYCLKADGS